MSFKFRSCFVLTILFFISCGNSDNRDSNGLEVQCIKTNCHGVEVTCGFGELMACTEEYALGDLCRQYVTCEVKEGNCVSQESVKYKDCVDCIKLCEGKDPLEVFNCDSDCRTSLEK